MYFKIYNMKYGITTWNFRGNNRICDTHKFALCSLKNWLCGIHKAVLMMQKLQDHLLVFIRVFLILKYLSLSAWNSNNIGGIACTGSERSVWSFVSCFIRHLLLLFQNVTCMIQTINRQTGGLPLKMFQQKLL